MPNPIKYTTGSETLALKKGNFYIGTGDVGKGPSDSTGYYQGPNVSSSGYVIYMNKPGAPGSLSYHNAANDSELISFTNNLAGQSYTSATQCLVYFAGQTDKVVLNRNYESIITNGLIFNSDAGFSPSYPQSGTTWYDLSLSGTNCTLYNAPTFSGGSVVFDGVDDYGSLGNISYNRTNFSCFVWFNATSYYNNWRSGVFTKWTSTNAPSMSEWSIGFNASSGPSNFGAIIQKDLTTVGNWLNVTGGPNYTLDTWYNLGFTWNSGVLSLYLNGEFINSGSTNVTVPNTTNQPVMIASFADGTTYSSPMRVLNAMIYNKTLSSSEILQNYYSILNSRIIVTDKLVLNLQAGNLNSYPGSGSVWKDVSGYGSDMTLLNGPTFNSANGGYITFDNTDDFGYINVTSANSLGNVNISMEMWIKNPNSNFIMNGVYGGYFSSGFYSGGLLKNSVGSTGPAWTGTSTWQQWVAVWDQSANETRLYVNGTLRNTSSNTYWTPSTGGKLVFGGAANGSGYSKEGSVDISVFRFYNKVLTSAEITQNYNANKTQFGL